MENKLIAIEDICAHHQIEINFIKSLEDVGLIQTTVVKQTFFLNADELTKLERFLRLSHDLDINFEGLHAVSHLLEQLNNMQEEMSSLKNELNYYKQMQ
ncbi:chaperone modulator CbpM [Pedobacter endophyticus]|uniref:Chaperone modulator CbpM n=1 Tax=Pedobacter endophyticus TaxID=2789740 RepID=A0A7S9L2Q3_9SPHI|nr:chaperone modulator CbpM [Pedobacter endophyticus]QPH41387.1 chaperone modulator CbpM [Pedobacter endophyticus]